MIANDFTTEDTGNASAMCPTSLRNMANIPRRANIADKVKVIRRKTKGTAKRALLSQCSFCWWRRVDSNHRSDTQQIYSLPHLATLELLHIQL